MAQTAHYFEYILIYTPTDEDGKAGRPKLISDGVQGCVAKNQDEALMIAARAIPEEYADKLSDVEISLRPFR